jgi:hypothetical protein
MNRTYNNDQDMMVQSPGKIFLAEHGGIRETGTARRSFTFSYADYLNECRPAFGRLYALNTEELAGACRLGVEIPESSFAVLLPLTGGLICMSGRKRMAELVPGEVWVEALPAGSRISIRNPFRTDAVSYLMMLVKSNPGYHSPVRHINTFDLAAHQDKWIEIIAQETAGIANKLPFSLHIGRFGGRKEALYRMKNPANRLFVFALSGAFETEGRLLHARDGLALWDIQAMESEALSDQACMLLAELCD